MLAKLLTLLTATKGATVAAAIVIGAATVTVGATTPEVQDTVKQAVETVTNTVTGSPTRDAAQVTKTATTECEHAKPAVVAQRNAASKLIDAAFKTDHKALEELRKGGDNKAASEALKTADEALKDLRTKGLNDVAKLTLGREGQDKPGDASKVSKTPEATEHAARCPAEAAEAPEAAEASKTGASPKTEDSAKASPEGRVTVAEQTTLDANVKSIVDKTIADMAAVVKDAKAKLGTLPSSERKSTDKPAENKPAETKSTDKPSGETQPTSTSGDDHNKPTESPRR